MNSLFFQYLPVLFCLNTGKSCIAPSTFKYVLDFEWFLNLHSHTHSHSYTLFSFLRSLPLQRKLDTACHLWIKLNYLYVSWSLISIQNFIWLSNLAQKVPNRCTHIYSSTKNDLLRSTYKPPKHVWDWLVWW